MIHIQCCAVRFISVAALDVQIYEPKIEAYVSILTLIKKHLL